MERVGQSGVLSYFFRWGNKAQRDFSDILVEICYNAKKERERYTPPYPSKKMEKRRQARLMPVLYRFPLFKIFWFLRVAIECKRKIFQTIIKNSTRFIKVVLGGAFGR